MQEETLETKIDHLSKLMGMAEMGDKPSKGKVISIPRIDPKKPFSEFLCVEKMRPTASMLQKNGNWYGLFQEQERLTFIPGEVQTIDFYIKIKCPTGFYGLVLSNEQFIVINPVIVNYTAVSITMKYIGKQERITQKNDLLLKMILLPTVNTEIREVISVANLQ